MFEPCSDVHHDNLVPCDLCSTVICQICNRGSECRWGCGPGMKRKSSEIAVDEDMKRPIKRRAVILLFEEGETCERDALRAPPEPMPFYGFVKDIEIEQLRSGGVLHHITFECFRCRWFDRVNLSNLPLWTNLPLEAEPCHVLLIVTPELLDELVTRKDIIHQGEWVRLLIGYRNPEGDRQGAPIMVFLPPEGTGDAVRIPWSGRMSDNYVILSIDRVPPTTTGSRKLKRLWRAIDGI